ncbi:protein kinase domain-containing protein [Chitinimonas lacunae]|uniref:Protein kinase n=1 Tax=Chitinimonas lacunae TaxID=1963018 RepID=A0ABV8MU56_9NEIS
MMPAKIGKYRVERELGRGATGVVYLGRDGFRGSPVAIKLAHQALLADPRRGPRYRHFLETEAALVGRLQHPHIVAVLDAELDDLGGDAYIVMEYVDGESLEAYTAPDSLLPVREVIEIAFKCCNALDHARQLGLIHRDIKPANLLRSRDGELKLTDFGAALALHSDQTQVLGLIGSPAYMSPEQVREAELTHQSDIFSLGVVLYELLAGRRPFQGDNDFATIYKITHEQAPPLKTMRPELPKALCAVVERALAKRPTERHADWQAFAAELAGVARHLPRNSESASQLEQFNLLRAMPFFAGFPDVMLWEALRLGSWHELPRGTELMREGCPGDSFYMLARGRVEVSRHGWEIAELEPGVSIGEMAYLNPEERVRTASVVADTDIAVLKIRGDSLRQASPELQTRFDKAFIRLLIERLQATNRQLSDPDLDPLA